MFTTSLTAVKNNPAVTKSGKLVTNPRSKFVTKTAL